MSDNEERNWFKIAGAVILLVPVVMFLIFTIGEVVGGDISGLQHLVEAGAIALVALFAWRWPALVGGFLVIIGASLSALYLYDRYGNATVLSILLTELVFFTPMMIAGVLLLLGAREDRQRSPG